MRCLPLKAQQFISHIAGVISDSLYHLSRCEYMKKAPCKKQSASFNNIKFRHKKSAMLNYIVLNLKQI